MKIAYVRFVQSIASPGYGGNDISKARLRTSETQATSARDELMDEMEVVEPFLVLRAVRTQGKRQVLAERLTPLSNCRDLEPYVEPTQPKGTTK